MHEGNQDRLDADLRHRVEALQRAVRSVGQAPLGDIPSCEETRELLGLYAKLQSADLRRIMLGLMRAIVDAPR